MTDLLVGPQAMRRDALRYCDYTHTHTRPLLVHERVTTVPFFFALNLKGPAVQTKEKYKRTEDRFYRIGEWIEPPRAARVTRQVEE